MNVKAQHIGGKVGDSQVTIDPLLHSAGEVTNVRLAVKVRGFLLPSISTNMKVVSLYQYMQRRSWAEFPRIEDSLPDDLPRLPEAWNVSYPEN